MANRGETLSRIAQRASEVGVEVWFHAADLDSPQWIGHGSDEPVVMASVLKVPVAITLAHLAASKTIDLSEHLRVAPRGSAPSSFGLATFQHDVTISLHDLAVLMTGISDNLAADIIIERVGKDRIAENLNRLGCEVTAVPQTCQEVLDTISEDLRLLAEEDGWPPSLPRLRALRALQPAQTCRTTPREMTQLLRKIWLDEASDPQACGMVRRWMELQVWPHRLRSGFPDDSVRTAGKTGTLPAVRNEVGVIRYADGGRYAVSVFTEASDARAIVPERDSFIGYVAAQAVDWLRSPPSGGAL
ncbi:MAG: serine hydrolase [Micromonosporaceae bacterium]|nr:serine hydrolase [Micromonosporaceae bacterium]